MMMLLVNKLFFVNELLEFSRIVINYLYSAYTLN